MADSTNCQICGRQLSNFSSVKLGIGPICKEKKNPQMQLPFENHAEYDLITANSQFIYIEDTGHHQFKTVTNDVQYVLSSLVKDNSLSNQRVFYKDSSGDIDEIVHTQGVFQQFRHGSGPYSLDELEGRITATKKISVKKKSLEYELDR